MHRRWIFISWSSSQIEIWRGPLVICHPVTDLTSKLDSLLIPPIVANCRTISELWKRDPNPWFCGLTYVYLGAYSVRISVLHLHPSVSSTELNQAKSARYVYSTLYRYVINDMARQVPTAHFSLSTSHPPPGPPLSSLLKKKSTGQRISHPAHPAPLPINRSIPGFVQGSSYPCPAVHYSLVQSSTSISECAG